MWIKEEVEWVSMLNFGWKMPLMNRDCFMVSTTKSIVDIFEDESFIKNLMKMSSTFVL